MVKLLSSTEAPAERILTSSLFNMFKFSYSMKRLEFIVWMGHTALLSWNMGTILLYSR